MFYSKCILKLLKIWQKCLDKSGAVGTIMMNLSEAYDYIPHDLRFATLAVYGSDKIALSVMQDYFSNWCQLFKIGSSFGSFLDIYRGVPQVAILGPISYSTFF